MGKISKATCSVATSKQPQTLESRGIDCRYQEASHLTRRFIMPIDLNALGR